MSYTSDKFASTSCFCTHSLFIMTNHTISFTTLNILSFFPIKMQMNIDLCHTVFFCGFNLAELIVLVHVLKEKTILDTVPSLLSRVFQHLFKLRLNYALHGNRNINRYPCTNNNIKAMYEPIYYHILRFYM